MKPRTHIHEINLTVHSQWDWFQLFQGGRPLLTTSLPSSIAPIFLTPFFPSVSLPLSCSLSSFFVPLYTSLCPSPWIARNRSQSFCNLIRHCSNFRILGKKIFMPDILEYVSVHNPTIIWQKVGRKVQLCFHQRGKEKRECMSWRWSASHSCAQQPYCHYAYSTTTVKHLHHHMWNTLGVTHKV